MLALMYLNIPIPGGPLFEREKRVSYLETQTAVVQSLAHPLGPPVRLLEVLASGLRLTRQLQHRMR